MGGGLGMNTMRVFLQDQLWTQDAPGFQKADRYISGRFRQNTI